MDDLKKKLEDALEPLVGQPITSETKNLLIPMIRKVMPKIIAQDIVGVQPMIKPKMLPKFIVLDVQDVPDGHYALEVDFEVQHWIAQQPVHMWKYFDGPEDMRIDRHRYLVSEQLYNWMLMRWS